MIRSDLNANRTVRVQGLLYSKSMRKVELFRIQNAAKGRLRSRFRTQYGNLEPEPIELKGTGIVFILIAFTIFRGYNLLYIKSQLTFI